MASRCHQMSAASAATMTISTIQPAWDLRGARTITGALDSSLSLVSARTSRIAPTDRSSAASVAADSYR